MRALLFLSLSQLKNSIRRSLTSVKRLVSLLVFAVYMYGVVLRPFTSNQMRLPVSPVRFTLPPVDVLSSIIFGIAIVLTCIMISSVGVQRSGFRSADVDVLFPTPVDPRAVLLVRILRENFAGLIFPLVFAIVGGSMFGRNVNMLFHQRGMAPGLAAHTYQWMMVGYISVLAFWIATGYAYTLWAYQDNKPKWYGKIASWYSIASLLIVAAALSAILRQPEFHYGDLVNAAMHGPMRLIFPTATAMTFIGSTAMTGNYFSTAVALVSLWSGTGVMLWLATKNVSWMYEQTALSVSAQKSTRSAMRTGDFMAAFTQRAREGKIKKRRIRLIERLRWHGPAAVVWRDMIVLLRTSVTSFTMLLVFGAIYSVVLGMVGHRESAMLGKLGLFVAPSMSFMVAFAYSRTGFLDLLRRIDTDKALPFSLFQLLIAHSSMRNFLACLMGWLLLIIPLILSSSNLHAVLAIAVALPGFAFLISGCVLLFMLIFPDMEDPSQRMLRELLTMVLMVLALTPGVVAATLVILVAETAYFAAAVAGGLVFLTVGLLVFVGCGELYAAHNPNE